MNTESRVYTYHIQGMDCNEEVIPLKRELVEYAEGEENLKFDLLNSKLSITIPAQSEVAEEDLLKAIARTGMKASKWVSARSFDKNRTDISFWMKHGRKTLCLLSGTFLVIAFAVHVSVHGFLDALSPMEGAHTTPPVSLALFILSTISGAWFIVPKAIYSARKLRADMNLLMTIAVTGAFIIGEWFEGAAVAFLFSFALLLESWSVGKARKSISALVDLTPATARSKNCCSNEITEKPVEEIRVDEVVVVRPGEKIPLDGIVITGNGTVNQAPITGESMPVEITENDRVYAGSINGNSTIEFRVTKPWKDTTLARIISMVEDAQSRKAPVEKWVEKFARYYTPAMLLVALLIAVVPPLFGSGNWLFWFYEALVILVIACPCALVISTPVSIVASLTAAAKAGVLIKGGTFIEELANVKAIALDKTGTLTYGRPSVHEVVPLNQHSREEILQYSSSLESHSTHPLASAILEYTESAGVKYEPASDFKIIQGKGAEGTIDGANFWIGSHTMMHERGKETPEFHDIAVRMEKEGKSVIAMGEDDHVCAIISIADSIRDESREMVSELKSISIDEIVMLTGDNNGTASAIAKNSGVDTFLAEQLPEDKAKAMQNLHKKYGKTAMVGDGINDAPAMANASVSIAMGGIGSDAAIETADITLMSDDIKKIPWLIKHARRTLKIIKQNIFFALGLKLVFVLMAMAGVATLWMAIAADMGASLLVIFNGLRLLNGKVSLPNPQLS